MKERIVSFLEDKAIQDYPQLVQALAILDLAESIREIKAVIESCTEHIDIKLGDSKWDIRKQDYLYPGSCNARGSAGYKADK